MEFPDFEKIKINNALIVGLIIMACVLFPLSLHLLIRPEILDSKNLLILTIATIIVGSTQFGYVYFLSVLHNAFTKPDNAKGEELVFHVLRLPLLQAVTLNLLNYFLVFYENFNKVLPLREGIDTFFFFDKLLAVFVFGSFVQMCFQLFRRRRNITPPPTNPGTPSQTA
jgi:hypothetical protein